MGITLTERKNKPTTLTSAYFDILDPIAKVLRDYDGYVVIGRCLSGSRHFSEIIPFEEVADMVDKYCGVVEYFGGGIVEVYSEDGELIDSCVAVNFDL